MVNLLWGGVESNQVGTGEFVDFCRRVGADPLVCVNFESDGRKQYTAIGRNSVRTADAEEAAAWVAYCNDAANAERTGTRPRATARRPALADRQRNVLRQEWVRPRDRRAKDRGVRAQPCAPRIADLQMIAWGDSGWAARMAEVAGEHVQYLAFHHMFDPDDPRQPVLRGEAYRRDPDAAWDQLMKAWERTDAKIRDDAPEPGRHARIPLAMTECHFTIPGRDRGDVVASWAAGVSYARILNKHERHGDVLKIATAADFCGTRWQNNAVIIPMPKGNNRAYLQPVARVMRLYRHHGGTAAVAVASAPRPLDVTASISAHTIFLHVANTNRTQAVRAALQVKGRHNPARARFRDRADPTEEISYLNSSEIMQTRERTLQAGAPWEFPAASVSAIELSLDTQSP